MRLAGSLEKVAFPTKDIIDILGHSTLPGCA
jgi:hypothetical protein